VPAALLEAQVRAALELGPLHALKLGQVPDRATLRALQRALADVSLPWVVDPVVASSGGGALTRLTPRDYLRLAAPHVVLTPNLDEAAWLLGCKPLASVADAQEAGRVLVSLGFGAAVVKGGHQPRGAVDVVVTRAGVERLSGARLRGSRVGQKRGKGCRFASALAVGLGRGEGVGEAAAQAKAAVAEYLRAP
jgi:hydroxymethylpyrimidine/phosphomethylpyrimidine kinase